MPSSIEQTWQRIETVLRQHAPESHATLAPPASRESIDEFERRCGYPVPEDLRASWLVHDGQIDPTGGCLNFCGHWQLLPVAQCLEFWTMTTQIGEEIEDKDALPRQPVVVNRGWWKRSCIPFAGCEGDLLCVDMDPALGPSLGRVVMHGHMDELDPLQTPSYRAWLALVAERLQRGAFCRGEMGYFHLDLKYPYA